MVGESILGHGRIREDNEMETIKEQLDKLAEYQAQRQVIALRKQELVDKVMTPEIKQALAEIDGRYAVEIFSVDENIGILTNNIKQAVLLEGVSVKGTFLHAVYSKPRVTWDSGKLEGLALAFPPLLEARKIGEASVSIRDVK
jgi:hypothetical protein